MVGSARPGDSWHSFLCVLWHNTQYSCLCSSRTEPTYPCQRTLGTHFCAQCTTDDWKSSKNKIFIIFKLSQALFLLASNIHLIFLSFCTFYSQALYLLASNNPLNILYHSWHSWHSTHKFYFCLLLIIYLIILDILDVLLTSFISACS